ncbi:hypothetical protein B296_00028406 [Ensete ventricosum]|uniref:Uncharacterized protein n=1 Tax=Ensete ventricosum TaxID=4639 RepID=A0A426XRR9_ENSVE|nr:hypothetical protein B296_00028406 [Ensete ventricosum]
MIILLTKRCPSPLPSPSLRVVAPRRPCPPTPALPRGGRCCLYGRRRAHGQHLHGRRPCGCSCELPPFQAIASACRCRPYERQPLSQASHGLAASWPWPIALAGCPGRSRQHPCRGPWPQPVALLQVARPWPAALQGPGHGQPPLQMT